MNIIVLRSSVIKTIELLRVFFINVCIFLLNATKAILNRYFNAPLLMYIVPFFSFLRPECPSPATALTVCLSDTTAAACVLSFPITRAP